MTLTPKPVKTPQKRKLRADISDKYSHKKPQQNISEPNSAIH